MSNEIITTVTDATENQKGVAIKGGGGSGGISAINNLPPDSSGNFSIIGDDATGIKVAEAAYPPGVLKINASEAGLYQRGTIRTSSENNTQEGSDTQTAVTPRSLGSKLGAQTKGKFAMGADYGYPIKWVDLPAPPAPSYVPMPIKKFGSSTVAEPNFCYVLIDPTTETPAPLQLPERGSFKTNDEIEVVNLSGTTFKVTLKASGDDIIRFDDQTIESIDGKFLLSEGAGSFVRLKAESNQLWFVINRNRVTVSAGG